MDLLPTSRRGEFIGMNMVLTNIFQSAGALLGGALFAWTAGYRAIFNRRPVLRCFSAGTHAPCDSFGKHARNAARTRLTLAPFCTRRTA